MEFNRSKLMWACVLTLIAAGMGFAVRGGLLLDWGEKFGFTQVDLGTITGGGLTGFGVVILLASLVTDRLGYKAILFTAFILHVVSVVVTVCATPAYDAGGKDAAYWFLFAGVFIFAVANGLCETAINPLIANIYPEKKTHYLNILHAGWPGGLILGGLLGYVLVGKEGIPWEVPLGLYLLPTLWYGFIVAREKFPASDVQKAGISTGEMLMEFASPVLLFLLLLHACVGYVELGTDSWIVNITESMTQQGFLLFIYTSALMFVLRFFAGPIVEKINPLGLLCGSTVLGALGLLFLSSVQSVALAWVAVTVYGLGKTFLWPTMLGIVGERFPRGGAITMGAIGGAGALSAGLIAGPAIGYKQDYNAAEQLQTQNVETYERYAAADAAGLWFFPAAPQVRGLDGQKVGVILDGGGPAATLKKDIAKLEQQNEAVPAVLSDLNQWWDSTASEHQGGDKGPVEEARIHGGRMALKWTAAVPAGMFVGYLILVIYFRMKGGYTQIELTEGEKKPEDDEQMPDE